MAQSAPLLIRLVASSITAANRAGKIIRDVMSQGDLGIVEKVCILNRVMYSYFFLHTMILRFDF